MQLGASSERKGEGIRLHSFLPSIQRRWRKQVQTLMVDLFASFRCMALTDVPGTVVELLLSLTRLWDRGENKILEAPLWSGPFLLLLPRPLSENFYRY